MAQKQGYTRLQIALHWAIFVLIVVNFIISDGMGRALRAHNAGTDVAFFPATFHVYVGLSVFFLVLLRLAVRWFSGVPDASEAGGALMTRAAHWGHMTLYALMAAMPFLGALAWYKGVKWAGDAHEIAMNVLILVAGVHAAAALFHQFVLKDRLLDRMRPR